MSACCSYNDVVSCQLIQGDGLPAIIRLNLAGVRKTHRPFLFSLAIFVKSPSRDQALQEGQNKGVFRIGAGAFRCLGD